MLSLTPRLESPVDHEELQELVRRRRRERALISARVYLRSAPQAPPRTSVAFLTTTTGTAPAGSDRGQPHVLDVLGLHRGQRAVYFVEKLDGEVPLVHVLHLGGAHAGRLTPILSWYDGPPRRLDLSFRSRLRTLRSELVPVAPVDEQGWVLTTRVVRHRAQRTVDGQPPIRKFTLALCVEPARATLGEAVTAGPITYGRTTVTAYLRPRAELDGVWALPGESLAIARVSYVGVPNEAGHTKHTAMLVRV